MTSSGEKVLWFSAGVALAAIGGTALGFERVPDEQGNAVPGVGTTLPVDSPAAPNNNGEVGPQTTGNEQIPIPTVDIPTTVGSAAVTESITLPRTNLACDGPVINDLSVDSRAYFASTGQYSILVALDNRFNPAGNEAVSNVLRDVPPEFAHDLSTDLAEYNNIPLQGFNPDNFPPGTYKAPTSCDAPGRPNYIP